MTESPNPDAGRASAAESSTDALHELSSRAVDLIADLDPCLAIVQGLPTANAGLTDFSPTGHDDRLQTHRDLLAAARALIPGTPADRIGRQVLVDQLATWVEAAEAGDHLRDLNILFSPPQLVRMSLELLGPGTGTERVAELLDAVPRALAGWRASLDHGIETGRPAARRQAVAVAEQLRTYADSWVGPYAAARLGEGDAEPARQAARAFADTSVWLADVYAPAADPDDAVGAERYRRAARAFNGVDLDLAETFAWGWEEVDRLTRELRAEVDLIDPELALAGVRERLDRDPDYQLHGVAALTEHLEQLTATATDRIDGRLFDIDPRVRECGVRIAAEGAAAAPYYVPPSEDLTRPGSTWYPTRGADVFPRWWLTSVWFHEGVPGHHLQLGAIATADGMSRFQRALGATSGQAEGWALYAERLADELGWFDEPGTRIGFLSAQLMRAVRVVVDIGMHVGGEVPAGFPGLGGPVTPALALRLLRDVALLDPDFAASEVDRYLGMPGQAISYKVGERVWLEQREQARRALGPDFDLKAWHVAAIGLGPMGLAQFAAELSQRPR